MISLIYVSYPVSGSPANNRHIRRKPLEVEDALIRNLSSWWTCNSSCAIENISIRPRSSSWTCNFSFTAYFNPRNSRFCPALLGQEHLPFMFLDKRVGTLEPRSFLDPVHHSLLRPSTMSNIPSPLWRGVVASHIPHTVLLPWSWLAICLPMLVFMH